jgi:hypothetical protein
LGEVAVGAKTALFAFTESDLPTVLRRATKQETSVRDAAIREAAPSEVPALGATRSDPAEVEAMVRAVHPGYDVIPVRDGFLADLVFPSATAVYATVLPGAALFCSRRLVSHLPFELPVHLLNVAAGRRILLHTMQSTVDALTFGVWADGRLLRSLAMSPHGGIVENIGEPLGFEAPFWAGERSAGEGYPLPFHPLDLGEEALRALFGFVLEGRPRPDDVDAGEVHMQGFQVRDPAGPEGEDDDAQYRAALEQMAPHRRFRTGPDGALTEVTGN